MRKRLSYLLFSTILTVSFLTGCKENSNSSSEDTTISSEQLETTPEKPVVLKPGYTKAAPSTLISAYTINNQTKHFNGDIFQASSDNENALLVSENSNLILKNAHIYKSGNTTAENENRYYGQNAALAVVNESTASINNTTVTSNAFGANAVIAAGQNTSMMIKDLAATTTGDNSNGLVSSYQGELTAFNVSVTTTGAYSAPVSVEKEDGSIYITKGKLSASNVVSPCLYSTGTIVLDSVTGNSKNNAASIEGGSITWNDCSFTSGGDYGVLLYETSTSSSGTTSFSSKHSKFSSTATDSIFYATNTSASINLTNTSITSSAKTLLNCTGNTNAGWGITGENGATVQLNADSQQLSGDILCDEISQVAIDLQNNSILSGAINTENSGDSVSICLDSSSTWDVTGTSYVHQLENADSSCSNIISNGNTIYYDDSEASNRWLGGQTIALDHGGSLTPMN